MRLEGDEIYYEINPLATPFERLEETHRTTSAFDWRYFQVYADDLEDYLSVSNPAKGINYNHPVTQFILDSQSETADPHKWFRWGIHTVTRDLVNDKDFDEKQPSEWGKDTLGYVKLAINHWRKVNWNEIPENVRPPYRILFPSSGRSYDLSLEYLEARLRQADVEQVTHEKRLADLE